MSAADRILGVIEDMANTTSRAEKERLLNLVLDDELGKFVVKWAYDPFITFGLTPVRQGVSGIITFKPYLLVKLLNELARRELTGNAAEAEVAQVMATLEPAGAELLFRILSKDLKCGIAATTINTVSPGFIPVFSVMRAHKFEEKRIKKWPQIIEPKYDGYRYTFLCRDGNGGFFSRSGIRQASCDHLVEPMIDVALDALAASHNDDLRFTLSTRPGDLARYARDDLNFMVDGEMMVPGNFNATGALRRTSETADGAFFQVFDIMSYADFDAVGSVGKPYKERRALVEAFVEYSETKAIQKSERYWVNSFAEIHDFYEKFRARGLEGAMVKNPEGLYDKKKSYGWLKIKAEESEDLPIVGAYPGEPNTKYEHCLGGVIVRRENGVEVRVGGGFSDEQREELWKLWQADQERERRDFAGVDLEPRDYRVQGFKLLGRLIEVMFHEETPDGSLRHPRFKVFRDDKAGEIESKEAA